MISYHGLLQDLALQATLAGRYAEAETLLKLIVGDLADSAYVYYLLGHTQYQLRRFAEAAVALGVSVALDPHQASAQNDLSATLFALGREAEALPALERALQARPDLAEAQETYAIELLRNGRLREGWRQYEARLRSTTGKRYWRGFAQPQWTGAEPLQGRTILLSSEQGAGDTFQFVRYAPLVAAHGATVLLVVDAPLRSVLAGMAGVSGLFVHGEALPPFDLHCPLLSLPLAFDTGLDSIPASVPYLFAAPERVAQWRQVLGPRGDARRVGIVFSGNPAHPDDARRSIPLVQFLRLLPARPDRAFHLLQNDMRATDRGVLELLPQVHDHSGALVDYADTAALISLMDLVVTVDTSVAHLAGAMGAPVWTLLPFKPDWRWMIGREDSPWYPTMRLVRQGRAGDWESVLEEVEQRMEEGVG